MWPTTPPQYIQPSQQHPFQMYRAPWQAPSNTRSTQQTQPMVQMAPVMNEQQQMFHMLHQPQPQLSMQFLQFQLMQQQQQQQQQQLFLQWQQQQQQQQQQAQQQSVIQQTSGLQSHSSSPLPTKPSSADAASVATPAINVTTHAQAIDVTKADDDQNEQGLSNTTPAANQRQLIAAAQLIQNLQLPQLPEAYTEEDGSVGQADKQRKESTEDNNTQMTAFSRRQTEEDPSAQTNKEMTVDTNMTSIQTHTAQADSLEALILSPPSQMQVEAQVDNARMPPPPTQPPAQEPLDQLLVLLKENATLKQENLRLKESQTDRGKIRHPVTSVLAHLSAVALDAHTSLAPTTPLTLEDYLQQRQSQQQSLTFSTPALLQRVVTDLMRQPAAFSVEEGAVISTYLSDQIGRECATYQAEQATALQQILLPLCKFIIHEPNEGQDTTQVLSKQQSAIRFLSCLGNSPSTAPLVLSALIHVLAQFITNLQQLLQEHQHGSKATGRLTNVHHHTLTHPHLFLCTHVTAYESSFYLCQLIEQLMVIPAAQQTEQQEQPHVLTALLHDALPLFRQMYHASFSASLHAAVPLLCIYLWRVFALVLEIDCDLKTSVLLQYIQREQQKKMQAESA